MTTRLRATSKRSDVSHCALLNEEAFSLTAAYSTNLHNFALSERFLQEKLESLVVEACQKTKARQTEGKEKTRRENEFLRVYQIGRNPRRQYPPPRRLGGWMMSMNSRSGFPGAAAAARVRGVREKTFGSQQQGLDHES